VDYGRENYQNEKEITLEKNLYKGNAVQFGILIAIAATIKAAKCLLEI